MVKKIEKVDFKVETFDRISYHLIVIEGSFTIKNLLNVRSVITGILDSGVKNIVFELAKVDRMDSSSIGLLGNLFKQLLKVSGTLGTLNPSETVNKIFKETSLNQIVKVFSTVESIDEYFEM